MEKLRNLKSYCATFREFAKRKGLKVGDEYSPLDYADFIESLSPKEYDKIVERDISEHYHISKHIAEAALKEYSEIEKLYTENINKTIKELYCIFRLKYSANVFDYDGESFIVMPDRVYATITEYNGVPVLLSHFDIDVSENENEIIWQCDYTVEELKDIIKGE